MERSIAICLTLVVLSDAFSTNCIRLAVNDGCARGRQPLPTSAEAKRVIQQTSQCVCTFAGSHISAVPRTLLLQPQARHVSSRRGGRLRGLKMSAETMECTEENVQRALQAARAQWQQPDMFGQTERARRVGITGAVELAALDGPFVVLRFTGRFWHRRTTVMGCVAGVISQRIPEIADVSVEEPEMLRDVEQEFDPLTGEVVFEVDRRSEDFNGDRATMEYAGLDPDTRGPFGQTPFG